MTKTSVRQGIRAGLMSLVLLAGITYQLVIPEDTRPRAGGESCTRHSQCLSGICDDFSSTCHTPSDENSALSEKMLAATKPGPKLNWTSEACSQVEQWLREQRLDPAWVDGILALCRPKVADLH